MKLSHSYIGVLGMSDFPLGFFQNTLYLVRIGDNSVIGYDNGNFVIRLFNEGWKPMHVSYEDLKSVVFNNPNYKFISKEDLLDNPVMSNRSVRTVFKEFLNCNLVIVADNGYSFRFQDSSIIYKLDRQVTWHNYHYPLIYLKRMYRKFSKSYHAIDCLLYDKIPFLSNKSVRSVE